MKSDTSTTIESREPREPRHCQASTPTPAGVFSRVGPGYLTCPTILAAMGVLRRDLAHAEESLEAARAAFIADGDEDADGDELAKVDAALLKARFQLGHEITRHRRYLASGEPERLAGLDR